MPGTATTMCWCAGLVLVLVSVMVPVDAGLEDLLSILTSKSESFTEEQLRSVGFNAVKTGPGLFTVSIKDPLTTGGATVGQLQFEDNKQVLTVVCFPDSGLPARTPQQAIELVNKLNARAAFEGRMFVKAGTERDVRKYCMSHKVLLLTKTELDKSQSKTAPDVLKESELERANLRVLRMLHKSMVVDTLLFHVELARPPVYNDDSGTGGTGGLGGDKEQDSDFMAMFAVTGAGPGGNGTTNGVYKRQTGVLQYGAPVYKHTEGHAYLFRYKLRSVWWYISRVISHDDRNDFYRVRCTRLPCSKPPSLGWEVGRHHPELAPAPRVYALRPKGSGRAEL